MQVTKLMDAHNIGQAIEYRPLGGQYSPVLRRPVMTRELLLVLAAVSEKGIREMDTLTYRCYLTDAPSRNHFMGSHKVILTSRH